MSQVKLEQIIAPGKASPETKVVDGATIAPETTGALVAIDTTGLNAESLDILNQIIIAEDRNKAKDLTQLFIDNHNKKTMVRLDSLNELQNKLIGQLSRRVTERPDEISNQELMQAVKIIQDLIDRSTKSITDPVDKPLIQINSQSNSVNVGDGTNTYSRESRDRVRNAVMSLLSSINDTVADKEVIEEAEIKDQDDHD